MSAANSAAKKRRAPPNMDAPPTPRPGSNTTMPAMSPNSTTGMTLPQVIALIDKRLVHLETITKEKLIDTATEDSDEHGSSTGATLSKEILDEFNSRFEIMAEEIANIKNIVLNLQSYTMDVNKMLLQENKVLEEEKTRLHIENTNIKFHDMKDEEDDFNDDPMEQEPVPRVPQWKTL
jgi:hypothetical protein